MKCDGRWWKKEWLVVVSLHFTFVVGYYAVMGKIFSEQ
jgi:hypothetical protein